jgi:hypothetical protein
VNLVFKIVFGFMLLFLSVAIVAMLYLLLVGLVGFFNNIAITEFLGVGFLVFVIAIVSYILGDFFEKNI